MLKLLTFFSGIGAPEKALWNVVGRDFCVVDAVEFDKHAVASYNAIHKTMFEPQDITTWNKDVGCDMIVHGSPCQSFSISGKQEGGNEGSGTRSSLMHVSCEHIGRLKPKYVLWENVKNVLSPKHKHNFDAYLNKMESFGYTNYWKVLNTKDFGLPQNRERIFCVSILGEHKPYEFPSPVKLDLKLRDLLDDVVDEKYYLSNEYNIRFLNSSYKSSSKSIDVLGTTVGTGKGTNSRHWVYSAEKCIGCLSATDYKQPKQIFLEQIANINGNNSQANRIYSDTMSRTLVGEAGGGGAKTGWYETQNRIRRLTPKECFRLQGFTDEDYDNAKSVGVSDTQLYKQAGNAISITVLEAIFRQLFKGVTC